jgi:hypothetical protein
MAAQTAKAEKVEEILKTHYAQIRDRRGILSAMRACHSDRERSALAEGLSSQANTWATEALRAILERRDIIPRELASGSDLINKTIIRLARDAAEFYSISADDTTKSQDEDATFPNLRSEIREQLRGFLAKLTEGDWGANQRRHLTVRPVPPNVVKVDERLAEASEPLARADVPLVRPHGPQGVRGQLPVGEAEFEIEDQDAFTEAIRQTGWATDSDPPVTVPPEGIAKLAKSGLRELPPKFQNALGENEESHEGGEMNTWKRNLANLSIADQFAELAGKDESILGKAMRGQLKDIVWPFGIDRRLLENPFLRELREVESKLNDQQIELELLVKKPAAITPNSAVCPLPQACAKYDLKLPPFGHCAPETAEQTALRKNLEDAVALLQLNPAFPSVMLRIHDRMERAAQDLPREAHARITPARMDYAIAQLDIQAEELISLVLDIPTQNAFAVLLDTIVMPLAWGVFTGATNILPHDEQSHAKMHVLRDRAKSWKIKSYKRLAASTPPEKGNLAMLRANGKHKRVVTFDEASRFGGVSRRAIEKAAKKATDRTGEFLWSPS